MHTSQGRIWLTAAALSALAMAAGGAEQLGALRSIRPMLLDLCSPGRLVVLAISSLRPAANVLPQGGNSGNAGRTQAAEDASGRELLLRQLLIENARLRRELDRERDRSQQFLPQAESAETAQRPPLLDLRVIPARVLSRQDEFPEVLRELSISAGRVHGLNRSELVVQGAGRVIDAGQEQKIAAGDRVLDGLTVVGRIERAGRWTSLVQPVTAEGFRARVQLFRATGSERHAAAVAMLEGTGTPFCRLTGLEHTDAVATGDEVFAAGVEGLSGPPLYFGRVVRADFLAGGEWEVQVAPAMELDDLDTIQVLRWEWLKNAVSESAP